MVLVCSRWMLCMDVYFRIGLCFAPLGGTMVDSLHSVVAKVLYSDVMSLYSLKPDKPHHLCCARFLKLLYSEAKGLNNNNIDAMFSVPSISKDDDFDLEPLPENAFGEFGDFQLVGHGKQTNGYCGKYRTMYGCSRSELHDKITLDGKSYAGKVYMKPVFYSCDKPSCPVCYRYGWAVREARSIEGRLKEASKRFGQVEHIVCSLPSRDYGLSYKAMRRKVDRVLFSRAVVGGVKIFHGFRYNLRKHWYFSAHFHILGFILGGFGKCRGCKKVCFAHNCNGFMKRQYRLYHKDKYIVKVLGKRVSVYHTAYYLLHHSSVKKGVKRFRVATWFGVVSYRKMKFTPERRKALCPICRHDLEEHGYLGNNPDILAVLRSNRRSCENRKFFAGCLEDGRSAWMVVVRRKYGSGNYEE